MNKAEARRLGLIARRSLPPALRAEKSAAVSAHIAASDIFRRARIIFLYRAMADEVDLSRLDTAGKRIVYPYCLGGGTMQALEPLGGVFRRDRCGIEAPDPAQALPVAPEDIELALVPCTAFDLSGGRCGMGGGYYDRYLPACKRAFRLLVAFDCQKQKSVPRDALDAAMDAVVTEDGFVTF